MEKENFVLFGDRGSKRLFIQPVDEHDMELMNSEASALQKLVGHTDWCIAAVPVDDWNRDLTPWEAEPVFGKQGFGDGAAQTLDRLIRRVIPAIEREHPVPDRQYILCGYSMAGLFALWAAYQTDRFAGIVAASPSVWYRDWLTYAGGHDIRTPRVYLSLGDREEKTRNPVMASVAMPFARSTGCWRKQASTVSWTGTRAITLPTATAGWRGAWPGYAGHNKHKKAAIVRGWLLFCEQGNRA